MTDPASISLRYAAICASCATPLPRGTRAFWDRAAKTATCVDCAGATSRSDEPTPLDRGDAGGSTARRHRQLRERREERARKRWGRLSGVYLALTDEPRSTRVWSTGSIGERRLGAVLDELNDDTSLIVLHDRRIPGSRANVDHIVISTGGIFVVDAKHYSGQVRKVDRGGWLSTDYRLYVGRRDCSKLISGMAKQVDAVRGALGEPPMQDLGLAITPVVCFVAAEWSFFARPFRLGGVWVEWPKSLAKRLRKPGALTPQHVEAVARKLDARLPQA